MATYYKLTDEEGKTYGDTQWGEGITHEAVGGSTELCSDGLIHFYESIELAVMMNPIHGNFRTPQCWECTVDGGVYSDGTKSGAKKVTATKRVELPVVSMNQRIRFGILCALEVYSDERFVKWAEGWLSVRNRSKAAAAYVANATYAAANAAAFAAANVANATYAAANAANAAANAALNAAYAAANAAYVAYATYAAANAASTNQSINFTELAKKAIEEES